MPSLLTKSPPSRNRKTFQTGAEGIGGVPIRTPTLDHEVLDDSVKRGALVTLRNAILPPLPSAKLAEVLGRLWTNVSKELHDDTTDFGLTDGDVEEHDRIMRVSKRL